ncbi:hypothetical protein N7495_007963 [Penicillium taxi]|uniref:uncharacterized protein n=1 Tax=Penicillium taxi TaxID=168475 RepID=UPI002545930E|nr:uncharacterized protein N7495_007963 [Penicillium taxi]KAJ5887922.1 hypothetical protein N7495_007963 [Penicillium taxi]
MASSSLANEPPVDDVDTRSVSGSSESSNEEGWEDVEPDDETQPVIDLFSSQVFPDVRSMLKECKATHNFDLLKVRKDLNLDFFDTIKLVNYIRTAVKDGKIPDVSSKSNFDDDVYLKPVLEDDALLYSLDDVTEEQAESAAPTSEAERKVVELQEDLERLQLQFSEYRTAVQKSMEDQLNKEDDDKLDPKNATVSKFANANRISEADEDYFASYAYNGIHESMLKDAIRTDAYRDFVYGHKHLFKDKVVLDVGCGTGILSMFCAKAGAKQVISVDNSNIIDRAKEIVYDNQLGDVITCIRGKIEEVTLPVEKVDIIISEWMGYALLFEAMFDSVIYARDRYLADDGLMVPSHASLHIAPFADPEFVHSNVTFWKDVYGFKMDSMLLKIHDEALIRQVPHDSIPSESAEFLELPLHTITRSELVFLKNFQVTLKTDIDALDGWAIWFDIFFSPSRNLDSKKDVVKFTTGPHGPETHWQQAICLIDYGNNTPKPMKAGAVITGRIGYQKFEEGSRGLNIGIGWESQTIGWESQSISGNQKWALD